MLQPVKTALFPLVALTLFVSQAAAQVTLTTVSPASAQPLVTNVTVTGSRFPAGTITPAAVTVTLTPSAGNGSAVTTAATAVTTVIGATRQVSFRIPASLASASPFTADISLSGTASPSGATFTSTAKTITINPPAIITNVSQGAATRGSSVPLTVTAAYAHFLPGSSTLNAGAGITCDPGGIVVLSAIKLTANCAIDANATPGLRNFAVTTASETASLANAFLVSASNALGISSVSPNFALQGETKDITVTGVNTHFADGVTIANFSDGIAINPFTPGVPGSVRVISPTVAIVNISVSSVTPSGFRIVTLVTGGEYALASQSFSVGPSPAALSSVSPASGLQGQTLTATITGSGTHFAPNSTTVSFAAIPGGGTINTGAVQVLSPTSLTVDLTVSPTALPGLASLTVQTGGETVSLPAAFTVVAATPYISSVSPTSGIQGQTLDVTLNGKFTNFQLPATATFGSNVTVNSVTVLDAATARANITIGLASPTGGHTGNLHIQNLDLPFTFNVQPSNAAITGATPASGPQGASLSIAVTGSGTHFAQGTTTASINVSSRSLIVNRITVTSATAATIDVTIPPDEPAQLHSFSIATGGESLLVPGGFTVTPATPTLTMSPSAGGQGTSFPVEFTGQFTGFSDGTTTLNISGLGVTYTNFKVTGPSSATALLTVALDAPLTVFAPYTPRVVTLSTGTQVVTTGFSVTPGHYISSITPNSGTLGQTLTVAVQGVLTHFVAGQTTLTYGPDITVSGVTVTSPTTLTAQVAIANSAALGWRTAFVNTGSEYATVGFRIDLPFNATLLSVSPAAGQQGQSLTVNILGQYTNFKQGVTQAILGGGITVNSLTINNGQSATAQVSISPTAYSGLRTVSMITGGEVVSGLLFTVSPGVAILTSVTPNTGAQGQVVTVAIRGANTHFLQGSTTASATGGISVSSLTITDALNATAQLSIGNAAQLGLQTITLATAGEAASLQFGFTVTQATPILLSGTPATGQQGTTLNIALLGQATHWTQGTTTASFGPDITVNSVTVANAGSAIANITVSPTAFIGLRGFSVTTGAETVQLAVSFTVTSGSAALTLLTPNSARQGDTVTVHVTGQNTNFLQGATTASAGLNINVGVVTVNSPTSADVMLALGTTAVTGLRGFTLNTGGQSASIASGFTVQPGIPTLNSAAPVSLQQGLSGTVTILGQFTHFAQGATTVTAGQGIAISNITVLTANSLTANFVVDPIAFTGGRSVTVTTVGEIVSGSIFSVTASPAILSAISPNTGAQGQTADILLTGQNTHFSQGLTSASFGLGITLNSLVINSPLTATANITIAANATPGVRTVSVVTGGESLSQINGFIINAGAAVITGLSPASAKQGDSGINVQLTGQFTNWAAGTTVSFGSPDITVSSVTINNPTSLTAVISISPTAALGAKTVTVATGAQSLTAAFTVNTSLAVPSITYTPGFPTSALPGQTLTTSFNGLNTHFSVGTTTASFSAGITVNNVQVLSPTLVTANITIDSAAAIGNRTVTISTGGEVVTSAFGVVLGTPAITLINPGTITQGEANKVINVTGQFTTWIAGSTTANFGSGIVVNSVTVNGPTSATISLTANILAATGFRGFSITSGAQTVSNSPNSFSVTASAATISSVAPSAAKQNDTLNVAIAGTATNFVQGVTTANFGSGITVNSLTVNSATLATANISIAPLAATGPHTVTLSTQGESASLAGGFIVNPGTPVLLSSSPTTGQQQMDVTLAVLGQYTAWTQGQTIASLGAGITVTATTVTSPTSLQVTAHITPLAFTGLRDLTVTTGAQILVIPSAFSVVAGPAAISVLSPNTAKQGDANVAVAITGVNSNFAAGITTATFGPGVTVNSLTVTGLLSAIANITVSPAAAAAIQTVTLTTQGEAASIAAGFTIQAATPVLLTVTPNTITQGQTKDIAVLGSFTNFAAGTTTANFGTGITINSVTVTDSSHATVNITGTGTATLGPRDVTLSTGAETATKTASFTVQAGSAVISSLNPTSGRRAQTLSVTVTGTATNFAQGITTAAFGAGITVQSLTVNSLITATASLLIDPSAALGTRTVTLTTGGETATLAASFTVNAAVLQITTATLPNATTNAPYVQTVAVSGGAAPFVYSVSAGALPTGLNLNTANGNITGTTTSAATATFDITVTDASSQTVTRSYTVVTSDALTITTASLPPSLTGAPYSQTIGAQGGTAPRSFSVVSGTLPTGLTLTPAGLLAGTPTVALSFTFTIRVTDSLNQIFDKPYTLAIYAPLKFTTVTLPDTHRTLTYNHAISFTGGIPAVSIAVTAGAIPAGTLVNSATGTLSGSLATAGTFNFTLTATDANGNTATQALTLVVLDDFIITTSATLPNAFTNTPYSVTLATANGSAPVNFGITAGALPLGMVLNSATGTISGSPGTVQSASFTIQATDALTLTATQAFTLQVIPPPVILTVAPAQGPQGQTLDVAVTGQNTNFVNGTTSASFGIGVTVNTVTVSSATVAVVNVTIAPAAAAGTRTVTLTTGSETVSIAAAFNVIAGLPTITAITPAFGKKSTTVTATITGANLQGATFALKTFDPSDHSTPATVTIVSNNGTTASLTLVLGAVEGQFPLVAHTTLGDSAITAASQFLISPAGQNTATSFASILNTSYDPATARPLPAGSNTATSVISILNTSYDPTTAKPLPPGSNTATSYISILNTSFTPGASPYSTAASLSVAICNRNSGCTANAPTVITALPAQLNGSQTTSGAKHTTALSPSLAPINLARQVITGQTVSLNAEDIAAGSVVDFEINGAVLSSVTSAPYSTLFTVPEGVSDLVFRIVVHLAGGTESASPAIRLMVAADAGTTITGRITEAKSGVSLELAAAALYAEFFSLDAPVTALPTLAGRIPARTGYVTAINQPNPHALFGDDPLGAHLTNDYAARFTGELWVETAGDHQFWLSARSGAALSLDGNLLTDTGFTPHEPAESAATIKLTRGWHRLEAIYYHAVGAASMRLEWQQPGSARREVVGPDALRTELRNSSTVSGSEGNFTFPATPARLDTVWIRIRQGDAVTEYPALKPGLKEAIISVQ